MEDKLIKFRPAGAGPEMRARVLATAAGAARESSFWSSNAPLALLAALVLVGILVNVPARQETALAAMEPAPNPGIAAMARELAEMAGDGESLAQRFARALEGSPQEVTPVRNDQMKLMEEDLWNG